MNVMEFAAEIHADNVKAGWWTDINTGESIVATRNRPEMLMLIVSELSEASEGFGKPDDKLPQFAGFAVELADADIRLLDLLGAEGEIVPDSWVNDIHIADTADESLMRIVNIISRAMEHYRKGRRAEYIGSLYNAHMNINRLADLCDINLPEIIESKRQFNRNRPDHKIENRLKADGKKF